MGKREKWIKIDHWSISGILSNSEVLFTEEFKCDVKILFLFLYTYAILWWHLFLLLLFSVLFSSIFFKKIQSLFYEKKFLSLETTAVLKEKVFPKILVQVLQNISKELVIIFVQINKIYATKVTSRHEKENQFLALCYIIVFFSIRKPLTLNHMMHFYDY